MFDQGGDDALRILVHKLGQHHNAGMPLYQNGDIAVIGTDNQVTFLIADR
ncbi:MAG: hypothetical protein GY945_00775 [Rhodobacteraceae bacterium]|nr:hypothetical protein [Paracoccaceae bacterium]